MKKLYTLIIIVLFSAFGANAQSKVSYNNSKWFLGLNAGGTYHSNTEVDVNTRYRAGLGFTLGKSFNMEEGNFFSWDFRFRYLHANYRGLSKSKYNLDSTNTQILNLGSTLDQYQQAYGYYVPSFNAKVNDFSLELQLNTNRLRERTGWNLYVFGGIGLTHYKTAVDLTELGSVKPEDELFDKPDFTTGYETKAVERVEVMPHFGAGIDRQLGPNVSFGIMGRMSWTRHNDFDAMPNNMDGSLSTLNDRYHYVSAGFKFYLGRGERTKPTQTGTVVDPVTTPVGNGSGNQTPQRPIVDFTNPSHSPITVSNPNFHIDANVFYVSGSNNITFKQNGYTNQSFSYNANTDEFDANVILQSGQNIFEIIGVNNAGSDQKTTIIILKIPEVEEVNPPIVTITSPAQGGMVVSNSVYAFSSTILNVDGKSSTSMVFNNGTYTNYTYSTNTKVLTTTLNLNEGVNTITVNGVNSDGQDSKTTTIIYRKPKEVQPPVVTISNPSLSPHTIEINSFTVVGTVLNVDAKANIEVRLNGNSTSNFSYNTTNKQVQVPLTNLVLGVNMISIKGTNSVGQDIASTTLIYRLPKTPKPPVVTFVNPGISPTEVYVNSYPVVAKVLYVNSANDITVKVNGSLITNFNYSTSSDLVNFTAVLSFGANIIEVKGVNPDGEDIKTTTIVYKRPIVVEQKPIVTITNPSVDNVIYEVENIVVNATVLNVINASNIEVKFNGITTTNFTFNSATKVLTLPVNLVDGSNSVFVKGTNNAGVDSKTRLIIYKLPVVPTPPTVTFTNPPVTPFNVSNPLFLMTATTTHIDVKSQIVLKVNGYIIPSNQYAFSNNTIQYNMTLNAGSNVFEINVNNTFGSDSELAIVNLEVAEPCTAPTVGYIAPQPNSTVTDENVIIEAQINNYIPGTVVELFHNGVSVGNMNYNAMTSVAVKPLVMLSGSNAFVVKVSNSCGNNQSAFILILKPANIPCDEPVISTSQIISSPTDDEVYDFTFEVENISGLNDLVATLNGVVIPVTNTNGSSFLIDNAPLSVGVNTVIVNAVNNCGKDEYTYSVTRNECDQPIISITSETSVNSNSYLFTGIVTQIGDQNNITVTVNGKEVNFKFNSVTGVISADVNLQNGNNIIQVVANGCEEIEEDFSINYTEPCIAPIIDMTSSTTSVSSAYILAGTVSNATAVEVTLNGNSVPVNFNALTGVLVVNCELNEGDNVFEIKGIGCEVSVMSTNVVYTAPCISPIIKFVTVKKYKNNAYPLKVLISNVDVASDITLKVNGQITPFAFSNGVLTATLVLTESGADVEIIAKTCDEVSDTMHVDYLSPCVAPVVKISKLSQTVSSNLNGDNTVKYSLVAQVSSANAGGVVVTVNGTVVTSSYNALTGLLTANFPVIEGVNTVVITATGCETTTTTQSFTYETECVPPVITLTSASASTVSTYTLAGSITSIDAASDVSVKLNGNIVSPTYNTVTGILVASFTLVEGSNTIIVTANGCESVSKTLNVTYTAPCVAPVVKISKLSQTVSSNLNGDNTVKYSLVAQVSSANADGIVVTVNGTVVTSSYNALTGLLTANFSVIEGVNTVVVTATGCETTTTTQSFTYETECVPPVLKFVTVTSYKNSAYPLKVIISNVNSASELTLKVNGKVKPFDLTNGMLTTTLVLTESGADIELTAKTCEEVVETMHVDYLLPCVRPSIKLTSNNESTTSSYILSASVLNIDNAANVIVKLNGNIVNGSYNTSTDILTSTLSLIEGVNKIEIFANECGAVTNDFDITYTAPCVAPVIKLSSSNDSDVLNYTLTGKIRNASNVSVSLNGAIINSTYNSATGVLVAKCNLVEGSNRIVVKANGCEVVSQTKSVNYTITVKKPTVVTDLPRTTRQTVTSNTFYFKAKLTSIDSKSQINVNVNGKNQNAFIYSNRLKNVSGSFKLIEGMNLIVVTVRNTAGSNTLNYYIKYVPKKVIKKTVITKPKVTKPKVTKPKVTKPKVTKPKVTKPKVTKPKVTKPKVTKPKVTKPKVTKPKVTKPKVTKPKVTKPKVTKPKVTKPKENTPKKTTTGRG